MASASPRWDLSNVFPGLESPEFAAAMARYEQKVGELEQVFAGRVAALGPDSPRAEVAAALADVLARFNDLGERAGTLGPYIASFVTTDSRNTFARRLDSEFDLIGVRFRQLNTRFQAWAGSLAPVLDDLIASEPTVAAHTFVVREAAEQSRYLMPQEQEELAAELSLSSTTLWSNLQGVVTSQLTSEFELDGEVKTLPLPALINLHSHPDEAVRRRAYEAELAVLASAREPLAAAMNGIKGTTNTINRRRGRADALHQALDDSRIDRATLEAMLGAMEESFLTFRKYWRAKAHRLGKEQLPWWDVAVGREQEGVRVGRGAGLHPPALCRFLAETCGVGAARVRRWLDRRGAAAGQARRRILHEGVGAARVARPEQLRRLARPGLDPRSRVGARFS